MSTDSQPRTNVRPIGSAVLIRQAEAAGVSKGGIVIPDSAQEKTNVGEVLAVGPGRYTTMGVLVPCECKVGETVYWNKYQGTEVEPGLWLVKEDVIDGREPKEAA